MNNSKIPIRKKEIKDWDEYWDKPKGITNKLLKLVFLKNTQNYTFQNYCYTIIRSLHNCNYINIYLLYCYVLKFIL